MMRRVLVLLATGSFFAPYAQANVISLFETRFDTDFAYAGVGGLRGTGSGTIQLTGVSGTVQQAYLYWHGPTDSNDPAHNASLLLNGAPVVGSNIGFSDDNFWSRSNSQAYRADVTGLVAGNGNYSISGLIPNDSNGASLVVFFDDGDNTNNVDIVTFDGNDANFANSFDPLGWNISLSGINYTSGSASLVLGVSDGQSFTDGSFLLNGTTLLSGNVFEGTSVPQTPGSSVTNGGLWDILAVDITAFMTPGPVTLTLTHQGVLDALSAIHVSVVLPAGSAPDQPGPLPEPATLALFGLGLAGLGFGRRRMHV
ncbi:PEP-CTERM sorting domain-containing protein [Inmirania thermothiophila]|uniref:Putative secreted protein with PEP-CTERM sorting signal n=1 Tax=Inmirania thermothiophila TaxID=1750597 RepID=A0A3N1Y1I0_9GAMM|nr:PEP-CTERM sorting domain-containing protein [Inmirania thermothiophila]ROR32686.1 putative secreted protein with PEP-CTERM sorting signal [Inmirania thermothiophila]